MAAPGGITLHQFHRVGGVANASLFCMKVECWLRMAGLDYAIEWVSNPSRMPKGKCPVVAHEGRLIPDSTFILDYLEERFAPGLDRNLDAGARAASHAFARMLEERSYWVMTYARWIDPRGWPTVREHFFGRLPPVVRSIVPPIARRRVRRQLDGHGIGRHDEAEIYALGARDLAAVSDWLGDKPFFMGDAPTTVDATVYAFVANALHLFEGPLRDAARAHANLAPYCERMRLRCFPELAVA